MRVNWRGFAVLMALLASCSSERKLSHVESRVPASADARQENVIEQLRSRLSLQADIPALCPPEVHELAPLAGADVMFPPCSDSLAVAFANARAVLNLEEISAVEELLGRHCHANLREGTSEAIDGLLRETEKKPAGDDPKAVPRAALRAELLQIRTLTAPLNEWVRNNGERALPSEQLEFLDHLVNHDGCKMPDQEIDASYRTLQNLEDLVRIQADDEPQRKRLSRLLTGVHKVMDRKIQEYFKR